MHGRKSLEKVMPSYVLPFETPKSWRDKWINGQGRCTQGNHTQDTHKGDLRYAFDFKLRPGTKVLAGRAGVVVALCDHFVEGGMRESLRPRANFVALRHEDGTYSRYVHLMHNGVLVKVGQEVDAGETIALSGDTGFTSAPHLHFDVVNLLPQETSELWVVHPAVLPLPSIAAIFSGPLNRETRDFATAPLVYLSAGALLDHSLASKGNSNVGAYGVYGPPLPSATASLIPLMASRPEVIVLIDRGGGSGEQTFAEAAATAASAVAAMVVPDQLGFFGGGGGGGVGGGSRFCRCVGVIIVNDRPDHEVFPMAAPSTDDGEEWGRAPFPVVMVSHESGQLLKSMLESHNLRQPSTNFGGAAPERHFERGRCAPVVGMGQEAPSWSPIGGNEGSSQTMAGFGSGGWGGGGIMVSLGAAESCPAAAATAATRASSSCSGSSGVWHATNSAGEGFDEEEEEDDDDSDVYVEGARFLPTAVSPAFGGSPGWAGLGEFPFPHLCWSNHPWGSIGHVPSRFDSSEVRSSVLPDYGQPRPCEGNDAEERAYRRRFWRHEREGGGCRELKRERTLFRAETLPVTFSMPIW